MPPGRPSKRSRSTFGLRLHAAREAAGLSQAQVAKHLGITQTAYALWERREMALRPQQIEQLASILKVAPDYFFSKSTRSQRSSGPTGKLRKIFEEVSLLSRYQQQRIIAIIEDMIVAQRSKTKSR